MIRKLKRHADERGWLVELFREDELPEGYRPAMSYVSMTKAGVARGPHEHRKQSDCFAFPGPSTFRIYLWDNRPDSPTYESKYCFETGDSNPAAILVPPGVVHAYKNIGSADGMVFNFPDRLYAGTGREESPDEIRYENHKSSPFRLED